MLDHITPVLLTYNEEPNIARTLSRLAWAKDIVVVDSGSTDATLAILRNNPAVRIFSRAFDTHANQWRYAVEETNIATDWILRLDADYQIDDALIAEMACLDPKAPISAYRFGFTYCIFSRELVSSLYPANTLLFRKGFFSVRDRWHTEAWDVRGPISTLNARVLHDDRKPVSHWLSAQSRYMQIELGRMAANQGGLSHWLRHTPPLMPFAVFIYCLFGKGLIFNGRAGIFYALQRMVAEAILSLLVLEQKLRDAANQSTADKSQGRLN
jgi:glycosyltransferase involved in cell wall biosynthesis